jgi:hypothetical protein
MPISPATGSAGGASGASVGVSAAPPQAASIMVKIASMLRNKIRLFISFFSCLFCFYHGFLSFTHRFPFDTRFRPSWALIEKRNNFDTGKALEIPICDKKKRWV